MLPLAHAKQCAHALVTRPSRSRVQEFTSYKGVISDADRPTLTAKAKRTYIGALNVEVSLVFIKITLRCTYAYPYHLNVNYYLQV